jgi:hypothetical protein
MAGLVRVINNIAGVSVEGHDLSLKTYPFALHRFGKEVDIGAYFCDHDCDLRTQ